MDSNNKETKVNLPCIDCICLPICKHRDMPNIKTNNIGPFLTSLGNKCSLINDYLLLKDLGLNVREMDDSLSMAERKYITQPLCQRILEICEYMHWSEFDLDRERILAQGLIPKGEK